MNNFPFKLFLFFLLILIFVFNSIAQPNTNDSIRIRISYEIAFQQITGMLTGKNKLSFKEAVLISEAAYLQEDIDTAEFNKEIRTLVAFCQDFKSENNLLYDFKDKEEISKRPSVFKVMTDVVKKEVDNYIIYNTPFQYDFEDFFGEKDWTKMFVSKLLTTTAGNCHSLPYLYKILSEELGTTAHLALAPNHIYIKHKSLKTGWYNTELTSATFPIDAWIMASGYIHLDAIQNEIYMKALTDKESIVLCLIDLAEGYKRKVKNFDTNFILKCCDAALLYFPKYINAIILKAEVLKTRYQIFIYENPNSDFATKNEATRQFNKMQDLYVRIHELGYRQMPKQMYMNWLAELRNEKEKYLNKNVTSFSR